MLVCLYFTSILVIVLYLFFSHCFNVSFSCHLIRLCSSLQLSQPVRSWSTPAMQEPMTATPRLSVSRRRDRPSGASVLLATEGMDATVMVRACKYIYAVQDVFLDILSWQRMCISKCFIVLCLVYWCPPPHKHMQVKDSSRRCVCVSSTSVHPV